MASTVQLEKKGRLSIIRLDLPQKLNALEPVLRQDLKTVLRLANRIAEGPAFANGLTKNLLSKSLESSLDDMMRFEGLPQAICMQSQDHKEGTAAFYQKKTPVFKGR